MDGTKKNETVMKQDDSKIVVCPFSVKAVMNKEDGTVRVQTFHAHECTESPEYRRGGRKLFVRAKNIAERLVHTVCDNRTFQPNQIRSLAAYSFDATELAFSYQTGYRTKKS